MAYGVTSEGFVKKTRQNIIDEINASLWEIWPNLNLTSTSAPGQWVGIFGDQISQDWDVLEDSYDSRDPNAAASAALDDVCAITGTERAEATKSTATFIVTGDDATALTSGRQARVPAGGIFESDAGVTINAATAWAATTAYSVGDLRQNGSPANIYRCITAGTSAASGGPTGTGTSISDGTVTWRFIGIGEGYNTVAATATATGPTAAQTYQITEIVTAETGWKGVNNLADAAIGTNEELDPPLRIRRKEELATGKGTINSIRAALLKTAGVTTAFVFQNTSDVTDANNMPPHSIQCIVAGGTDADIAATIFDQVGGGIETYGVDIVETVVDSAGNNWTIQADRADEMELWMDITVVTDGNYPNDGDDQVAAALKAKADTLAIGEDVIYKQFESAPLSSCGGVAGVIDIQAFLINKQPATVTAANAEPYALVDGQTLTARVDGQSAAQTVTFNTADFAAIGAATAAEVAAVISTDLSSPSATGGTSGGAPTITSDSSGSVRVTGGSANGALGFPTSLTPTGQANIPIGNRQIAAADTARISVASV
jgi:hypothetical protein